MMNLIKVNFTWIEKDFDKICLKFAVLVRILFSPKQFIILPQIINGRFKFDYGPHLVRSQKSQSITNLMPALFTLSRNVITAPWSQYHRPVVIRRDQASRLTGRARAYRCLAYIQMYISHQCGS